MDSTRQIGVASITVTFFTSRVADAVGVERDTDYTLFNRTEASTNIGMEWLTTLRAGDYVATGSYTYVQSRETGAEGRLDAPLTPRHSAGLVGMWEPQKARCWQRPGGGLHRGAASRSQSVSH